MAQLKDSIITGDLRVTGTIYGNTSLNNLADADDLKAIEALSGTSGILKKTAANTWTLDTTNYTTNVGTITGVTGSDGLTGNGTSGSVTIKHAAPSQSPAKTTSAVYPITIDKYGHITTVGSAQTILTLGTGASNAAAGNHNHDSTYVNVSGDTMTGALNLSGVDINLKTSGTSSDDSGDIIWWYGNGKEKMRIWTSNTYTTKQGPLFRIYKSDGTSLYNGTLSLADHTHGNITNDGALSTASRAVVTDANKKITVVDMTVASPTAATTTSTTFIDTISQASNGKISATKKTLPTASTTTAGIIQIGTGASNAAAGNHNHDSTYVSKGENPLHIDILEGTGIVGTDAGSGVSPRYTPGTWTFNSNKELQDGDIFVIKIPIAGTVGVWMSVDNGTTYHPITLHNTSRLTTQYPVGTCISVIYQSTGTVSTYALNGADSTATVTGVFRVLNYYDANTTYSAMSVAEIKAGTATTARTIRADYLKSAFTAASDGVFKTGSANGTISVYGTNIAVKGLGTAAYTASTDYAGSGHTHTTSIATSNETNQLTLAFGEKYAITAGGTSYIFTTPTNPNTDTAVLQTETNSPHWRKVLVGYQYDGNPNVAVTSQTNQAYVSPNLEFRSQSGTLKAIEYSINGNATLQYNSTTESLDFVF